MEFVIDFNPFEINIKLPEELQINDDDLFDDFSISDLKDSFLQFLPKDAIHLGHIDVVIENNWTSFEIEDEYFLVPLNNSDFNWALIRLSCDDNWETWHWVFDARLKSPNLTQREASKELLKGLWKSWDLDLEETGNEDYLKLFNNI